MRFLATKKKGIREDARKSDVACPERCPTCQALFAVSKGVKRS